MPRELFERKQLAGLPQALLAAGIMIAAMTKTQLKAHRQTMLVWMPGRSIISDPSLEPLQLLPHLRSGRRLAPHQRRRQRQRRRRQHQRRQHQRQAALVLAPAALVLVPLPQVLAPHQRRRQRRRRQRQHQHRQKLLSRVQAGRWRRERALPLDPGRRGVGSAGGRIGRRHTSRARRRQNGLRTWPSG
jgi:hypothetical protein